MNNISIILGYGIFVKPMPEYQQYLETLLKDIINRQSDLIIICGGCSNKNYPKLSEAVSIRDFFLDLHPELNHQIIIEDKSLSTPQSLENSFDLIEQSHNDFSSINVYCDSCRSPKVLYLALSLLDKTLTEKDKLEIIGHIYLNNSPDVSQKTFFNYKKLNIVGIPLSNNMSLIAHQIMSSMLEMHSFDYPDFHQQFVDWRKKQWGVR